MKRIHSSARPTDLPDRSQAAFLILKSLSMAGGGTEIVRELSYPSPIGCPCLAHWSVWLGNGNPKHITIFVAKKKTLSLGFSKNITPHVRPRKIWLSLNWSGSKNSHVVFGGRA